MDDQITRRSQHGSVLLSVAAAMLVACTALIGGYFFLGSGKATAAGPAHAKTTSAKTTSGKTIAKAPQLTAVTIKVAATDQVSLRLGDQTIRETWGALGVSKQDGIDRKKLTSALTELKRGYDESPVDARMDLEARKIHKERRGRAIDLYAATNALELAAYAGRTSVVLPTVALPPTVTVKDLGIEDISHVLASFTTRFAIAERSRNYNLKLAASKLNGHVLQPDELFKFNDTVGARSAENGYKIAHVITSGEMVDGLAGGTCQISTTLHGAAFFSGLQIVRSRPHSRPSTYVEMGLDATVVYGFTDMHLRNTYDFPVVIHYKVARGESVVRILGKKRPYDRVEFHREVLKRIPFDTVTRESDEMPIGSIIVEQHGFPGYKIRRRRKYYRKGKVVKKDTWVLRYKPVTEYVINGTNPDPNLTPPKQKRGHGPRPPRRDVKRISQ